MEEEKKKKQLLWTEKGKVKKRERCKTGVRHE